MDDEHWTLREPDGARRRLLWPGVLLVATALLGAVLYASLRDDDPAPTAGGSPPRIAVVEAAPPTTLEASPPSTVVAGTLPVSVATTPPTSGGDGVAGDDDDDDDGADDRDGALRDVVAYVGAEDVSPVVSIAGGTFAMVTAGGEASLLGWDGERWTERDVLRTPRSVRSVDTVDVTGDGAEDFVVWVDGDRSAGVYAYSGGRWDWLSFTGPVGSSEFVDRLEVAGGRLRSDVADATGNRQTAEWRWGGDTFTIR